MSEYNFEGRVAVITGAGRGIGRAYALLLAERGASVVVNDLGGTKEGDGKDEHPAVSVAAEIVDRGGRAIPDTNDVSEVAGGQGLIDGALREFGRIDILVNNAGIIRWAGLPEADADNLESHLAVHVERVLQHDACRLAPYGRPRLRAHRDDQLDGNVRASRQPRLRHGQGGRHRDDPQPQAGGGGPRHHDQSHRPQCLDTMGARPSDRPDSLDRPTPSHLEPELVAPMVAFLAHERCTVSGEMYVAGAGRFARIFIASTQGYVPPRLEPTTIEDVAEHWATINDEHGYYVPADLMDWSGHYLAHRRPS